MQYSDYQYELRLRVMVEVFYKMSEVRMSVHIPLAEDFSNLA